MKKLSISLLGPLRVTLDGKPVSDFATDKARALLVYLAVEADHPHRRDALAGLLWPDQPQKKARQSLRQALSHLRQAICDGDDAPFLLVSRETIQFNPDCDHWLDVDKFATLVETCEQHRHRRLETCLPCIRRMERMVELCRGEFLEQFFVGDSSIFEEWAVLKREWFHREAMEALYHLANTYERRGDYKRAQQHAWRQVALESWREEAHRQLMRLLALGGQRSAALAQFETCRRALAGELGVEPTAETRALYERIREDRAGGEEYTHIPILALPSSPTPFVGREKELAELAELLANPDCRLVTIFGPGGIGKTRLALQAAADQVGSFEDGVAFVSLASVGSAESIVPTIADALGVPPQSNQSHARLLLNYLRDKEMLLVLDNVEHLLEGSDLLPGLYQHASDLVVLLTSRERLNLQEEWVYEIGGLTYPQNDETTPEAVYSAITLFHERARQVNRRFTLKDQGSHVAHVCQLVDGVPLGIELAAAWVATRSCEEIAQEIGRNLDVLATRMRNVPERHRSIRATFDHSWQLLPETEQVLLAQLSIFRGGFGKEAARAVTGATVNTLLDLLDKSLVRQVSPDRYDMHQLLCQYAAEKLESMPAAREAAQTQHAHYFTAFLGRQQLRLKTADQRQALQEIETEIENARLAWDVAVSRGWAEQVEQSLESVYQFYSVRGRFREGISLLDQAVERWRDDPQHQRVFGAALACWGALCIQLGYYDQAETALEESLTICQRLEATSERIFCLLHLSHVLRHRGAYDQAEVLASKSLALSRQIQDKWAIARALDLVGLLRYRKGDIDQAEALCEESLSISRQIGHQRLMLLALNKLADIACHRGDFERAQALFNECIALARTLGDSYNEAIHLNNQGTILHVLEDYAGAERLFLSSLQICRQISDRIGEAIALSNLSKVAHDLGNYEQALAHCREGLAIGRKVGDQWTLMSCLGNLGRTMCVLGDSLAARAYLAEALEIACDAQTSPVQMEILTYLGLFFAKHGQPDRAAEILTLTSQHPASELDVKNYARRLLDDLDLTPLEGVLRSLEAITAEVLAELALPTAAQIAP